MIAMRVLFWFCLIALTSSAGADPLAENCEHGRLSIEISAPLSIAEVERLNMVELPSDLLIKSDFQKAAFGTRYREWVAFKSLFRPGDQLVRYTSHERQWLRRNGEAGYELIRSGCLIGTFQTVWS